MLKILDLEEVGRKIFKANGLPAVLDSINVELTGWLGYYSEQIIRLDINEAVFHHNTKGEGEEKLSDKTVESLWKITEEGQDQTRTKQTLKFLEKAMSNIKASIRRAETESRNLT